MYVVTSNDQIGVPANQELFLITPRGWVGDGVGILRRSQYHIDIKMACLLHSCQPHKTKYGVSCRHPHSYSEQARPSVISNVKRVTFRIKNRFFFRRNIIIYYNKKIIKSAPSDLLEYITGVYLQKFRIFGGDIDEL